MKSKCVLENGMAAPKPDIRKAAGRAKPEPDRLDGQLLSAIAEGDLQGVKRLIEDGAKDSMNPYMMNAVKVAASNARLDVLRFLLEAGFEADVPDYDGRTALMAACKFHNPGAVRLLLEHGADVNRKSNGGSTALTTAVGFLDGETVRVLLDAGADPDAVNRGSREIELMLRDEMAKRG